MNIDLGISDFQPHSIKFSEINNISFQNEYRFSPRANEIVIEMKSKHTSLTSFLHPDTYYHKALSSRIILEIVKSSKMSMVRELSVSSAHIYFNFPYRHSQDKPLALPRLVVDGFGKHSMLDGCMPSNFLMESYGSQTLNEMCLLLIRNVLETSSNNNFNTC